MSDGGKIKRSQIMPVRNYFPSLMLRVAISSHGDKLFLVGVSFAFDVLPRRRIACSPGPRYSCIDPRNAVLCKCEHFLVRFCRVDDKSRNLIRMRGRAEILPIMLRITCVRKTRSISMEIPRHAIYTYKFREIKRERNRAFNVL